MSKNNVRELFKQLKKFEEKLKINWEVITRKNPLSLKIGPLKNLFLILTKIVKFQDDKLSSSSNKANLISSIKLHITKRDKTIKALFEAPSEHQAWYSMRSVENFLTLLGVLFVEIDAKKNIEEKSFSTLMKNIYHTSKSCYIRIKTCSNFLEGKEEEDFTEYWKLLVDLYMYVGRYYKKKVKYRHYYGLRERNIKLGIKYLNGALNIVKRLKDYDSRNEKMIIIYKSLIYFHMKNDDYENTLENILRGKDITFENESDFSHFYFFTTMEILERTRNNEFKKAEDLMKELIRKCDGYHEFHHYYMCYEHALDFYTDWWLSDSPFLRKGDSFVKFNGFLEKYPKKTYPTNYIAQTSLRDERDRHYMYVKSRKYKEVEKNFQTRLKEVTSYYKRNRSQRIRITDNVIKKEDIAAFYRKRDHEKLHKILDIGDIQYAVYVEPYFTNKSVMEIKIFSNVYFYSFKEEKNEEKRQKYLLKAYELIKCLKNNELDCETITKRAKLSVYVWKYCTSESEVEGRDECRKYLENAISLCVAKKNTEYLLRNFELYILFYKTQTMDTFVKEYEIKSSKQSCYDLESEKEIPINSIKRIRDISGIESPEKKKKKKKKRKLNNAQKVKKTNSDEVIVIDD